MARPLRIEFADAVYHVTARGNRQEPIFVDDADRRLFLDLLDQAFERFDASALAYCLMGNHYHLVLRTRQPNLSALMRHVNGIFTQRMNRRHGKVGHLFQGRFKAILVDGDDVIGVHEHGAWERLTDGQIVIRLTTIRERLTHSPGERLGEAWELLLRAEEVGFGV